MSSTAGRYSSTRPEAELFWACSVELSISKQSALQPAELASPQLDRAAPAVELFVSDRAAKAISNHSLHPTPPNVLFTIFYYLPPKDSSPYNSFSPTIPHISIPPIYYHSLTNYLFIVFEFKKKSYSICTVIIRIIIMFGAQTRLISWRNSVIRI